VAPLDSGIAAPAATTGPATGAARREEHERLASAIEALEPEEREAILARYFADRTVDEIAASLGRSPTAVRRLLGRAVVRLGERLRPGDLESIA
jgi:RNA polymerase sigma factor (sigma-70 family)